MRYTETNGVRIAYQLTGTAHPDIVLVAGPSSHLELDWQVERQARWFDQLGSLGRLIRFDRRGAGLSPPPPGRPDLENQMHDVLTVIDTVDSERSVLVGQATEAPLIALVAAAHPERIAGIVLLGVSSRADVSQLLTAVHLPTLLVAEVGTDFASPASSASSASSADSGDSGDSGDLEADGGSNPAVEAVRGFLATKVSGAAPLTSLAAVLWLAKGDSTRTVAALSARGAAQREAMGGAVVTFDGPATALRALYAERAAGHLNVAVGVTVAEVSRTSRRISGAAVDVAAHLAQHASPGEVLFSRAVTDRLGGTGIEFESAGELLPPDVDPIAAYRARTIG